MKLVERLRTPREEAVVEMLEAWLAAAKAGELQGVVLLGMGTDTWRSAWGGAITLISALGLMEMAKAEMIEEAKER